MLLFFKLFKCLKLIFECRKAALRPLTHPETFITDHSVGLLDFGQYHDDLTGLLSEFGNILNLLNLKKCLFDAGLS